MRTPSQLFLSVYTTRCNASTLLDLEAVFPRARTRFYAYGRQALTEALRAAGVVAGDRVLLPALICRELVTSLASVGADPVFYPVDERLHARIDATELQAVERAKAVIAVNYFGFPQALEPLRAWCRIRGAVLIEDNAHGFLSEDAGTLLGRRGDLGVFSLRKTLSLPNGAALIDNRDEPHVTSSAAYGASPRAAELRYQMKAGLKRLIVVGGLPMARFVRQALDCVNRGVRFPSAVHTLPLLTRERLSAMTLRLIGRCDATFERARRRTLYRQVEELLLSHGAQSVFAELPLGVVPYAYPFYAPDERMPALRRLLGSHGLMETSWPELPDAVSSSAPPHYKMLRCVPFLW